MSITKIMRYVTKYVLFAMLLCGNLIPVEAQTQPKTIKLRHVKQGKLAPTVYQKLRGTQHAKQVKLLGGNTIAPKPGFALLHVVDYNSYLCIPKPDGDLPSNFSMAVDNKPFRLPLSDGSYLWMLCICSGVYDACITSVEPSGSDDGLSFGCTGPTCCFQQWGLMDKDGGGIVFETEDGR